MFKILLDIYSNVGECREIQFCHTNNTSPKWIWMFHADLSRKPVRDRLVGLIFNVSEQCTHRDDIPAHVYFYKFEVSNHNSIYAIRKWLGVHSKGLFQAVDTEHPTVVSNGNFQETRECAIIFKSKLAIDSKLNMPVCNRINNSRSDIPRRSNQIHEWQASLISLIMNLSEHALSA